MDEFEYTKTYFADEQFDFESIMREFGSGRDGDSPDYASVGAVHFDLDENGELITSFVGSEEAPLSSEPEAEAGLDLSFADEPEDDLAEEEDKLFELSFDTSEAEPDDEPDVRFTDPEDDFEESAPEPPLREDAAESVRHGFGETLKNSVVRIAAAIALKFRQSRITFGEFMAEDDEAPAEELSPEKAAKFYDSHMKSLALRGRIAFVLTLVLIWLSYGLPVSGALRDVGVKSAVCTVLLLTVMLCGLDIITDGLTSLFRKRPHANTLIALSALLCAADGIVIAAGMKSAGLPFSVLPALTISLALLGSYLNCRSCRVSFNTLAVTRVPYTVSSDNSADGSGITLRKACTGIEGFVRRSEEAGPDEAAYGTMSPFLMAAALLLSLIAAIVSKSFAQFLHILSGIFVFSAPAAMLLSFPLTRLVSAMLLKKQGSVIAGWSGIYDVGMSHHIVVTDSDLFSPDNISIESVRILSGARAERVISLAGSIIAASGSDLVPVFSELMISGKGKMLRVDNFESHSGGGLTAMVDGVQVYCGSASFMHLMGVHLPEKYSIKNCIYLAENKTICGMFMMEYIASDAVKNSLRTLLRSKYHPIFALRDFNLTPQLISLKFDIATDGFDFPEYSDRYDISDTDDAGERVPAAVVSKNGLNSFVYLAEHAKDVCRRIRIGVLLSVLSTVIGIAMMFILSLTGAATVGIALTFSLVFLIPAVVIGLGVKS